MSIESEKYAEFAEKSFSWQFIEKPELDKVLKPLLNSSIKVLDAGCGNGRIISYLTENGIWEENVTAIDYDSKMINLARARFPKARIIESDISKVIKSLKNIDLITASFLFPYLDKEKMKQTLKNFNSWLKPEGHLIYMVPHPLSFVDVNIKDYFNRGWREKETPWGETVTLYHRTISNYIEETAKAGFSLEKITEPEVVNEGLNRDGYERYTTFPCRLLVKARNMRVTSPIF